MAIIGRLKPARWKEYRDLRLEALKMDPIAFGSSFGEEKRLSGREWRKRIGNALFALEKDKPVGMAVVFFNGKAKIRHISNLFGVYVRNEHRGRGIGDWLMFAAIALARKKAGIVKIKLNVNPEQKTAVSLYRKHGFAVAGRMRKELLVGGKCFDELVMEKFL